MRSSLFLLSVLAFGLIESQASANELSCARVFENFKASPVSNFFESQKSIVRDDFNFIPRLGAIDDYLYEKSRMDIFDKIDTRYSRRFETRFWFSNSSTKPRTEEPKSFIDPEAKAIFIFFHGSGTAQSSGRNFSGIMNSLTKMGFAAISFDMPFHGDGPLHEKFLNADVFMQWLRDIVLQCKQTQKPIYFVGHSFGPDVIAEYITRYPYDVDGGLLLSPAGFNKTLSKWYQQKTVKMKFGGEVPANESGGEFASQMSRQFTWNKGQLLDPTLVNTKLKMHMLTGDREEYVPAPIGGSRRVPIGPNTYDVGRAMQKIFSRVQVVVEKNVGHYIFNHTDEDGQNAVMREVLKLAGFFAVEQKDLLAGFSARLLERNIVERASQQFFADRNFQAWVLARMSEKQFLKLTLNAQNENLFKSMLAQYEDTKEKFENEILNVLSKDLPELRIFLSQNQALFQAYKKDKRTNASPFIRSFGMYLRSISESQRIRVLKSFE